MIKDEVFKRCTRCGKEFTDLKVEVNLGLYVERIRDTGVWEEVPNMNQESKEYLCPDCFNKLCDILSQMNLPEANGTFDNNHGVIIPKEENNECDCECDSSEDVKLEPSQPVRHHHRSDGYNELKEKEDSDYCGDDDYIEYIVRSKVIDHGVEVPGPDDGKVMRVSKKEWKKIQEQNQTHPLADGEKYNDVPHYADPDLLVDVCDDVIYC